jgi:RNA polymerase sigma-70 factor (ECF subfamily)
MSDGELCQRVKSARGGDREAMAWLFDRYQRRVVGFCLSFAPICVEDARDLTQEVFVRAFGGLARLERLERFEAWLFTIARRRCLTHLRRQARLRDEQGRAAEQARVEIEGRSHDEVRREIELGIVAEVIESMDDGNLKTAGRLFYRQGLDSGAIAESMGVPISTVTTWLSRFRARIRKRLVARILAHRSG